jgi:hypothetical protein
MPAISDRRPGMIALGDEPAKRLNEPSILNSRRASRFASQTSEAEIKMPANFVVKFCSAFLDRSHEVNSAARAVGFPTQFDIRRTGRLAKPTVHAVEK